MMKKINVILHDSCDIVYTKCISDFTNDMYIKSVYKVLEQSGLSTDEKKELIGKIINKKLVKDLNNTK